jgi:hypothetical protein
MPETPEAASAPQRGAVMLGARVLAEARAGHWAEVGPLVNQIAREYGADGQMTLLYGLADSLGTMVGGDGRTVAPMWREEGSADITGPGAVPPEMAWAGRFLAARIAWDREATEALLDAVPDDATWSRNVSALISMTALTINRLAGAEGGES